LLLRDIVNVSNGTPVRAIVEEVSGYAGVAQPGSAMFTFGRQFGFSMGVLQTLGCRIELVKPQVWQKALGLGITGRQKAPRGANPQTKRAISVANQRLKREWKRKLQQKAQQLFPNANATLATCDALLLLEFAKTISHE